MKAQDLRIDNIISDVNGNICFVTSVKSDLIIAKYTGVGSALGGIENFKGIPINEEWLLKFGFFRRSVGYGFDHKNMMITIGFESNYFSLQGMQFGNKIEFVHQLQNVWYLFTGTELQQI